MDFLEELVYGFVVALFIAILLGLFAISFDTIKKYRPKPLVMMPVKFISSFFAVREKEAKEKKDRREGKKAVRNRLYLLLMLNKDTANISRHTSLLNQADRGLFESLINEPLTIRNLERIFLGDYRLKSIGVFKTLYSSLSEDQMGELEKAERFLNKMGINVQSDCNLDEELGSILEKMPLTELFDKIARIKKVTGKDYKEAFNLVKTKRVENLRGILDFDFSEDQIGSVENMKEIYARISKKNTERISFDGKEELDFVNLSVDNQDLGLGKFTKEDDKKGSLELDQASTSFELPSSESQDMIAFTKRTLQETNSNRVISVFGDFDRNLKGKPIAVLKTKKQGKNKGSKR